MNHPTRCAHLVCKCEIPKERLDQGAQHCSDSCAVETTNAERCGCGHAPCDVELAAHPMDMVGVISVGPEGSGT